MIVDLIANSVLAALYDRNNVKVGAFQSGCLGELICVKMFGRNVTFSANIVAPLDRPETRDSFKILLLNVVT